jgi:hypothetical protein
MQQIHYKIKHELVKDTRFKNLEMNFADMEYVDIYVNLYNIFHQHL